MAEHLARMGARLSIVHRIAGLHGQPGRLQVMLQERRMLRPIQAFCLG